MNTDKIKPIMRRKLPEQTLFIREAKTELTITLAGTNFFVRMAFDFRGHPGHHPHPGVRILLENTPQQLDLVPIVHDYHASVEHTPLKLTPVFIITVKIHHATRRTRCQGRHQLTL
jgi:hypothetical protein